MNKDLRAKIEPDFNRATKLWHENRSVEAVEILRKLNDEFPDQTVIFATLGAIHFSKGDFVSSLTYFQKVVKLSPKSELASLGLFHSLIKHEQFDAALSEARRFINKNGLTEEYKLLMEELEENSFFGEGKSD